MQKIKGLGRKCRVTIMNLNLNVVFAKKCIGWTLYFVPTLILSLSFKIFYEKD